MSRNRGYGGPRCSRVDSGWRDGIIATFHFLGMRSYSKTWVSIRTVLGVPRISCFCMSVRFLVVLKGRRRRQGGVKYILYCTSLVEPWHTVFSAKTRE